MTQLHLVSMLGESLRQRSSYADAAKFGEIALLCTPWAGTENAIKLADPKNLAGKVGIEGARLLEPLAMLWVVVGFKLDRWEQAWKLLHK